MATTIEYENPYSASKRWLRGNIHTHQFCGGPIKPAITGKMYRQLHYDFIAITDHNQAHPQEEVEEWSRQAGVIIIPGVEHGNTDHIIELGTNQLTSVNSDDYAERARTLQAGGGFILGCHPQEYPDGEEKIKRGANHLHAIEIFNALREGRGTKEILNVQLWDELLAGGKRIWGVAVDDFHAAYIGPGQGWVCVQVPEQAKITWPLLVEQLKKGAFYASTYPGFESFNLEQGVLRVSAAKRTRMLKVLGPGGIILHEESGQTLEWRIDGGLPYFRVEAVNGGKRAWSQPFFRRQ